MEIRDNPSQDCSGQAEIKTGDRYFSPCGFTVKFWALAAFMKLSVSFRLLDLGQSAGLFGQVISSSQGLCQLPRVIVMMEKLVE
jgi:hypothetical protein